MYYTIRQNRFWPNMTFDVHNTVSNCKSCVINSSNAKNSCRLHLFPATSQLEFVAAVILAPLPKKMKGNQRVVIIINLYSILKVVVVVPQIVPYTVAESFFPT